MTREHTRLMIFSLTPREREPKVDLDLLRVFTETDWSVGVLFCSADNYRRVCHNTSSKLREENS